MDKKSYKLNDDIINKFMKDMLDNDTFPIEFRIKRVSIPPRTKIPDKVIKYIIEANQSNKPIKIETGIKVTSAQSNKPLNPKRHKISKKMKRIRRQQMTIQKKEKKKQRKEVHRQRKLLGNEAFARLVKKESAATGVTTQKAFKKVYQSQRKIGKTKYEKRQNKQTKKVERRVQMANKKIEKKKTIKNRNKNKASLRNQ